MKKKGNVCDFIESRNQNLRREFFARLGRNSRTIDQLFEDLARIPADRFYISEERALHGIRHDPGENALENKRRMLEDIARRVELLLEKHPDLPYRDAISRVVNSPAPSFYLTPRSIKTIVYRTLAKA